MYYANLLAVVGRLDDAAARVADGIEQARREGNAMALDYLGRLLAGGSISLRAGCPPLATRLSLCRPHSRQARPSRTYIRMLILAEVAAHTDDRNLLQQMANDARDAYPTGSSVVRRASAYVLARAAWQRDDVHEAMRWLGGDITLFGTPLSPHVLVRLILGARVASAAGDAGLRARVLQATEVLERERPPVPLLAGVAGYARGILERDAAGVGGCRGLA